MKLAPLFLAAILFASCAHHVKKVVVFGRGSVEINSGNITVRDDGPAVDTFNTFYQSSALNFTIKKPSGDEHVTIGTDGLYLVNAKKDTVIGIYQNYDSKRAGGKDINQDELKKAIDSLVQLTQNKNISKANRNFFVLPFQAVKISDNLDATIVPPFQQLNVTEQTGDKKLEVYRFYNISEIREILAKLQTFATPQKQSKDKGNKKTVIVKDKSEQF